MGVRDVYWSVTDRVPRWVWLVAGAVAVGVAIGLAGAYLAAEDSTLDDDDMPLEDSSGGGAVTAPVEELELRFVLADDFQVFDEASGLRSVAVDLPAVARALGATSVGEVSGADDGATWLTLSADGGRLLLEANLFEDGPAEMRVTFADADVDQRGSEPVEPGRVEEAAGEVFDAAGVVFDTVTVEQPALAVDGVLEFAVATGMVGFAGTPLGEVTVAPDGTLANARVLLAEIEEQRVTDPVGTFREVFESEFAERSSLDGAGWLTVDLPELFDDPAAGDGPVTIELTSASPVLVATPDRGDVAAWAVRTRGGGTLDVERG